MNHIKAKDMLAVDYDSPLKSATKSHAPAVDGCTVDAQGALFISCMKCLER